jgi:hypothetical protein
MRFLTICLILFFSCILFAQPGLARQRTLSSGFETVAMKPIFNNHVESISFFKKRQTASRPLVDITEDKHQMKNDWDITAIRNNQDENLSLFTLILNP